MTSLIIICGVLSAIILFAVMSPFFWGAGGSLQDAAASDSVEDLASRQVAILQRWLRDERAASRGEISTTEWAQRQRYLTSRYVDVARRVSWLRSQEVKS